MVIGPILDDSYRGNHRCSMFMSKVALSCSEDIVLGEVISDLSLSAPSSMIPLYHSGMGNQDASIKVEHYPHFYQLETVLTITH